MHLLKGQKVGVTQGRTMQNLTLKLGWTAGSQAMELDASAFLLSADKRCSREEDFIFYGNPVSGNGAASYKTLTQGDKAEIAIAFPRVPENVAAIALTLTIYEGEQRGHFMKDVSPVSQGSGLR